MGVANIEIIGYPEKNAMKVLDALSCTLKIGFRYSNTTNLLKTGPFRNTLVSVQNISIIVKIVYILENWPDFPNKMVKFSIYQEVGCLHPLQNLTLPNSFEFTKNYFPVAHFFECTWKKEVKNDMTRISWEYHVRFPCELSFFVWEWSQEKKVEKLSLSSIFLQRKNFCWMLFDKITGNFDTFRSLENSPWIVAFMDVVRTICYDVCLQKMFLMSIWIHRHMDILHYSYSLKY